MKVVIAGGSGFLGRLLTSRLVLSGHEVTILTRETAPALRNADRPMVTWQPDGSVGDWAHALDRADAVVNLSGAGIADRRWSRKRKEILRSSRVLSTRSLVAAIAAASVRPQVFVQGSAVGYYGAARGAQVIDESSPPGDDFFGRLATTWEAEAQPATLLGLRLVILRNGVVLASGGGALPKMRPPFLLFGGGPIGSGQQYFSWIHHDDWTALVLRALTTSTFTGAINATAPAPVTNAEFSTALGHALRRPSWLKVPATVLRLLVGEMADAALLNGQRVVPRRALALGFTFRYPTVDVALEEIEHGPRG